MCLTLPRAAWAALLVVIAVACANPLPPEGGAQDLMPPQLVEERSTPSLQTNFVKQPIELTFDEWVEVQDVFNQVVISPPLEYRHDVRLKKRTVIFEFDEREELRPEATYTINFGEAVRDLTERNPAENLRFVFSTGDFIDSLSVSGKIVDAQTAKPVDGVLFMLYDNLSDTVVRKDRPFYFARTDTSGRFLIENVKAGTFKGFALKDANRNYRFDQAQEPIGFPDSLLVLSDTSRPEVLIRLFTEEQPLRLLDKDDSRYGLLRLSFNRPISDLGVAFLHQDVGQQIIYEIAPDTVKVWYDLPEETAWKLFLAQDTLFRDTVQLRARSRSQFLAQAELKIARAGAQVTSFNPSRPIEIVFNHPIAEYDTSLIRFYEDTLLTVIEPLMAIDTNGQRRLTFSYSWKEGLPYQMELLPGALTDIYGLQNDTIALAYRAELRKNYGNLSLTLDSLSAEQQYIVELLDRSDKVVERFLVRDTPSYQREFRALPPGSYSVRIITDWNANGRWDSGYYGLYRQPEPILTQPLEQQLRANWDLDATVIFRE
jgi:uncharacterized protein (DUF2141 family)